MTSIIKVDNLQNQCGANIINENAGTITIGASGDTVTLAAGASQSGFGRSGSVNWDTTPKTANFTGVSGEGYFVDTTSGAITIDLPATPSAGDIVAIADYNGTAGTNNITVGRNSSNINGSAADFIISINYGAISFVYVDATAGWRSVDTSDTSSLINTFVSATGGTITTCGDFKIHTFTGPGTFTVNTTGPGSSTVDYLVVAGGGGGGFDRGGGGGAGGFRQNFPSSCAGIPVTAQAYPITVGGGGTGQTSYCVAGTNGSNSIFSTITSTGGGKGAGAPNSPPMAAGSGGSGGGGHGQFLLTGGTGNSPPTSPSQGNNGGAGSPSPAYGSGGGGGASAVGGTGTPTVGGVGGAGSANSITGSPVTYAGGGGGSVDQSGSARPGGAGGAGGGGAGGSAPGAAGTPGTINTGGGGGGAANVPNNDAGNGGSGIIVIRYKYQ
jgi:hypothetical protein